MRYKSALPILVISLALLPLTALAQGRGHGSGATTHGPKTTSQGPKTTTSHGPKTTTSHGPKTTTAKGPKSKTEHARGPKAKSPTATTTAPTPTSPALPRNQKLVDRLRMMLPAGTDMEKASSGFRNQGQFVAAVHVSDNLGLKFDDLKTRMVDRGLSLGEAIQDMKPTANATTEVRRATRQADDDLRLPAGATKRSKR